MAQGKYTVNEVEERTGVPATTLRQWERRYGVPKPERTTSGYRLYSDDDVRDVRLIKAHVEDGVPASRAAEMTRQRSIQVEAGPRPLAALRHELVEALVDLDEARADRAMAEAHALYSVEDVVLDLLHHTMREMGERWHEGRIATTTEHYATAYVQGRLRQVMAFSGQHAGPAVIVACAPLDQHDIAALMLAVMLRRSGFRVYYVGANTPVDDLVCMASELHPAAVLISASSVDAFQQLLQKREQLKGIAPVLGLGGHGFNADPRRAELLGGVYLADNVRDAVGRLHALVAQRQPQGVA
jgi:MerR family transcriptional regulator, light-induced transcriptional regulator